jgi:predicted glycosyltransferase
MVKTVIKPELTAEEEENQLIRSQPEEVVEVFFMLHPSTLNPKPLLNEIVSLIST